MLQGEYGSKPWMPCCADEGDDGFHVFWGQPFDGWHVTEGAMMGARPVLDWEQERSVGVVARLVHLGEGVFKNNYDLVVERSLTQQQQWEALLTSCDL